MTISNCLTFSRLLLTPLFLVLYLYYEVLGISSQTMPYILLLLLIVSEVTDFLDGFLARRLKQVTDLGKIVDPLADSLAHNTVFLAFSQGVVSLPIIIPFVLLYRDSLISTLRTACALTGRALAARPAGKFKAASQGIAAIFIALLMIPHSTGQLSDHSLHLCSAIAAGIAALISVWSMTDYLWANRSLIKSLLQPSKTESSEND